ncbi:MAG: deoxynucleoside kinase [Gammaproteobacteria bacterium]|nr:deoxynucleoside kinase [Gammaproteobacteria bacterium]
MAKPKFLVIEGPIGVGKTSLARRLADTFGSELLLEGAADNPFLDRFYRNPKQAALPTQLFFLFQRAQQLAELAQDDIFQPVRVSDFLIEKDRLFAELTLDADELKLYEQAYQHLSPKAPTPDLVVYLQAPAEVLLERIRRRGIPSEQSIEIDYLKRIVDAYTRLFHFYDRTPLLIVNAATFDPINREDDYQALLEHVMSVPQGRQYFNPLPLAL